MTDPEPAADDPGDLFLQRVRRASVSILGNSPAGQEVAGLCEDHRHARHMILQDRTMGQTVVAVVGAVGQGKSWLVQQMVAGSDAAQAIRSGNLEADATKQITWIGSQPPADLDPRRERFLYCAPDSMVDIGGRYVLVDTPGATDDDHRIAETARRALSMAGVLLMVIRRDQIRSQTVSVLSTLGEGTVVVPILNAVRNPEDEELAADADQIVARMREAAPTGTILAPVQVADFEVQAIPAEQAAQAALRQLARRLTPYLDGHLSDDRRRRTRLAAAEARFRESLRATLKEHLPGLTRAVDRLNDEANQLPRDVALSLVGGPEALRAGIRSRLRLHVMTETASLLFPYRSLLGLLNLTHGAWDRVVLSLSGSLPSLITTAWTGARNLGRSGQTERDLRSGLRERSDAAVRDRLGPPITRFHEQIKTLTAGEQTLPTGPLGRTDETTANFASLAGVDALQEASQRIFDEEIHRNAPRPLTIMALGLIGTLVFWALMAGPIVSLYRDYGAASYAILREGNGSLDAFPQPAIAMVLTSLLLSVLPTALFTMLVLTWAQRRGRVRRIEKEIRDRHETTIRKLQTDGVLRLQWHDPQLGDAEFLLTAGRNP